MRIDILTLFPGMFDGPFRESIIRRAIDRQLISVAIHNIRDWARDKHRMVDDYPYGGGAGMVMKPEPIFEAVEWLKAGGDLSSAVILLTPQGKLFCQEVARELASYERLVLICGHYEGVDERVREHLVTHEISIGDYVLTGGERPAMVGVDVVVRQLSGVLACEQSAREDSHAEGLLEYPQYTRPADYRGWRVPEVLLSGNHAEIAKWRRQQSILRTLKRRPDLLERAPLSKEEGQWVEVEAMHRDGVETA